MPDPDARASTSVVGDSRQVVYTDGACRGNPGPGGWAWAIPDGRFCSGAEAQSTNQRMEIKAVLDAVTVLEGPLEVVSDSTYVVNCFRDRWWEGWIRKGWMNSQRKEVANQDLWRPLIEAYREDPQRLRFRWVKGHATDPYNDLVDRLAVEAATLQRGRRGDGIPDDLPAPDRPGGNSPGESRRSRAKARKAAANQAVPADHLPVPAGHLIAVTGLRPPGLGGYDDNPVADRTRDKLCEILAAKAQLHPDLVVVTGLGLGAETLAAEAAQKAHVPFVAVLPYPEPDRPWPRETRQNFAKLLAAAREVLTMQEELPQTRQRAGQALARRDAWLVRHAAEAIVIWDRHDAMVGRTVRSFKDHLGEEQLWVLEPPSR